MASSLPFLITGIVSLFIGFLCGTILVLYCRRQKIDKSSTIFMQRKTTVLEHPPTRVSTRFDLESQDSGNVFEGLESQNVAIFEINVNYNDQLMTVVPHSRHEIRIDHFKPEVGYLPAIVTVDEKEESESEDESSTFATKLSYCDGTKEPQYNIYIRQFEDSNEDQKPILGLCVHTKALKVFELVKKQRKQHHMIIQRTKTDNGQFKTIFVGCARGVVNVKHNKTGIFRILLWWSLDE